MFKFTHKMMPPTLDKLFQKNSEIHSYNTRGASNLRTPKISTSLADRFITATGVRVWNKYSKEVNPNQKISTFKQNIITLLIAEYNA